MMGRPSRVNTAVQAAYHQRLGEPSDISELLPVLRAYAERCDRITEFGVRTGNSTVAFLSARPVELRSYDIQPFGLIKEFESFGAECGVGKFTFQQADTLKIEIEETDLLFIDTLHTYDQILGELRLHGQKATQLILIHDTEVFGEKGEDDQPGIVPAIALWLEENKNWQLHSSIPFGNGLYILERTA